MNKSNTEAPKRKVKKGDVWLVKPHDPSFPQPVVSHIDKLIEMALDKNLELDRLERLLSMKKEYDAEVARKEYFGALSEFQYTVPKIVKGKKVHFEHRDKTGETNYSYAELEDIKDVIREPIYQNGLTFSWDQTETEKSVSVVCVITHKGGHQEKSSPLSGEFDFSGKKAGLHAKASTITYLRRYTLTGILGLTSAESDDDGQLAAKSGKGKKEEVVGGKIKFSDTQLANAVKKVLAGEDTLIEIEKKVDLEPAQKTTLEMAEKQFKDKKS